MFLYLCWGCGSELEQMFNFDLVFLKEDAFQCS